MSRGPSPALALVVALVLTIVVPLTAQGIPYGVDRRPQPRGTVLDTLLPVAVGPYRRASFAPRTPVPVTEELRVGYGAGRDSVTVGLRIPGRPEDAQSVVRGARARAGSRKPDQGRDESFGADPSFVRTDRSLAWSRGGYYFSVEAATHESFDRFMQAFPY